MLAINSRAPDFTAQDQNGEKRSLSDYRGRWVLLYFYPKDFTPGCTTEACTIRDVFADFEKNNAAVLGVSADSVKSHSGFAEKYNLPFPILADPEKQIISAYGASGLFKRVSYLIDPQGHIMKAYVKVKPAEHAAEALADIAELNAVSA